VELLPDQLLVIGLPGGGGVGNPRERDPELVRQDVLDGLVSLEQARDAYGVALTGDLALDTAETARLRVPGEVKRSPPPSTRAAPPPPPGVRDTCD